MRLPTPNSLRASLVEMVYKGIPKFEELITIHTYIKSTLNLRGVYECTTKFIGCWGGGNLSGNIVDDLMAHMIRVVPFPRCII